MQYTTNESQGTGIGAPPNLVHNFSPMLLRYRTHTHYVSQAGIRQSYSRNLKIPFIRLAV